MEYVIEYKIVRRSCRTQSLTPKLYKVTQAAATRALLRQKKQNIQQ